MSHTRAGGNGNENENGNYAAQISQELFGWSCRNPTYLATEATEYVQTGCANVI